MDTLTQHLETLRTRLHATKNRWGSHLDFWDFIAAHANIAPRGAYNFAVGAKKNPRLSTIEGIEHALQAAEAVLSARGRTLT